MFRPDFVVCIALVLAGCATEESVEELVFEEPVTAVSIDGRAADVVIVGVEGLEGARVVSRTTWQDDPPEVDVDVVGGSLQLSTRCGVRVVSFGAKCEVDLEVEVPAGAPVGGTMGSGDLTLHALRGGVDVAVGSGSVTLVGVAGDLSLTAGSGDVSGSADAGSVDVEVGSGDIDLELGQAPGWTRLEAGSGDISVAMPAGAYDVSANTSSGTVSLVGIVDDPGSTDTIEVHTGSGDITVVGR